jgi:uncharacterized protein (TIGR02996 family)
MSQAAAAALLRAIIDDPDDDIPRLAYADWLDEHGQDSPRAELIRVQVERAGLPDGDARAAKLLRREKALLKQYGAGWCDTHLGMAGELRRGFLEHVTCWPDNALEAGAELVERFPVRSLCLRADPSDRDKIRQLARQPWLARLTALRLVRGTDADGLGHTGLKMLLESPHLTALRVLEVPGCGITAEGARLLAKASHLKGLRELDLTWCRIGPMGMEHLAGAAHLAGLTRLVLEATDLGPAGAAALAASPHLRQLRRLDLARAGIQIGGVRALAASAVLATVERLRLGRLRLGVLAAKCLGRCPHLGALRELDLNTNRLEDDGAAALADGPAPAGLTRLLLRRNRITRKGVRALAGAGHWKLRHLDLGGNGLSDKDKQQARGWFDKGVVRL